MDKYKQKAFSLIELSIVVLIIGILIAGVTQGSRLVRKSGIAVAQNLTTNAAVSSIPNLRLWLETSLDTSVSSASNNNSPEDGDLVSSWNDISPTNVNKINLAQPTSNLQPTYVANGINGLPTLSYLGTQYLFNNSGALDINDTTYTMIGVAQPTSATSVTAYQNILCQEASVAATGGRGALVLRPSTYGPGFSSHSNDYFPVGYTRYKNYIVAAVVNGQSVNVYVNSTTVNNGTLSLTNYGPNGSIISTGARAASGFTSMFSGYISEIIIYDRPLKQTEINEIYNYLSKKYNIALS